MHSNHMGFVYLGIFFSFLIIFLIRNIDSFKLTILKIAFECVWSTYLWGKKAWSKVSTDGLGEFESNKFERR